eukprot:7794970-Pyramimonas_sp.AAC.1
MMGPRLLGETIELCRELCASARRDHFWRAAAAEPDIGIGKHLQEESGLRKKTTSNGKTSPLERETPRRKALQNVETC